MDIVEIGERQAEVGEVLKVKPLGIFAMIDEGELDWKVVAISVDDQKAYLVDDIDDVEIYFPVYPTTFSSVVAEWILELLSNWGVCNFCNVSDLFWG